MSEANAMQRIIERVMSTQRIDVERSEYMMLKIVRNDYEQDGFRRMRNRFLKIKSMFDPLDL
eukprot:scaffold5015_cov51-Attheya_sp.AAC.4